MHMCLKMLPILWMEVLSLNIIVNHLRRSISHNWFLLQNVDILARPYCKRMSEILCSFHTTNEIPK